MHNWPAGGSHVHSTVYFRFAEKFPYGRAQGFRASPQELWSNHGALRSWPEGFWCLGVSFAVAPLVVCRVMRKETGGR